jgi:simple sugar transport system ATP-binding protein
VKKNSNDWQKLVDIQKDLGFHFDLNGIVGELTVGERQQLELVRLLWLGVEVLIMDEPTTGISAAQQEVLFSALKKLAGQARRLFSCPISWKRSRNCAAARSCCARDA